MARVLHRDGLMLVIDKPAGLPVHRGPKGGESLEDHFDALRFGLPRAPALAHRLDRETSGCLVLGRHRKALASLGLLFKHGKVEKTYWAVVEGGPTEDNGTIDVPLGRLDPSRGWWMKPDPAGLPSVTTWRVMGRGTHSVSAEERDASTAAAGQGLSSVVPSPLPNPPPQGGWGQAVTRVDGVPEAEGRRGSSERRRLTWLALKPLTGRTHQLRVHCAAMGWPILGDNIYGSGPRFGGPGLHLHAYDIAVPLSKNRDPVRVVAPLPRHMHTRFADCGWQDQ